MRIAQKVDQAVEVVLPNVIGKVGDGMIQKTNPTWLIPVHEWSGWAVTLHRVGVSLARKQIDRMESEAWTSPDHAAQTGSDRNGDCKD